MAVSGSGTVCAVITSKFWFRKLSANVIAILGGLAYAVGAVFFLLSHSIGALIVIASLLVGIGWGLYYNAAPFILSFFTNSKNRIMFFSYLSAFNVLGTGIAPVLIKSTLGENIAIIYAIAIATSLLSSLSFLGVKSNPLPTVVDPHQPSQTIRSSIINGLVNYPLIMVFLGACVFTMMLNFQTTYADAIGMNYAYFYGIYSLAVVLSRLLLGKFLMRFNPYKLNIFLLVMIVAALLLFLFLGVNHYFYGIGSAIFGLSYGLVYPTIQAIAVNTSAELQRADIISYFSLSYFIGVYAFPPLGGFLIVHCGHNGLLAVISSLALLELVVGLRLYRQTTSTASQLIP